MKRDYYAHVTPEGEGPRQRFLDAGGGQWELVAENIARCRNCGDLDRQRVAEFHQGWMNSPEHRENILRMGLTRFGFGAATEAGVICAVQTFAGPGTSRGNDRTEIEMEDVARLAREFVGEARADAGAPALPSSPILAGAAEAALPKDLDGFRLDDIDVFQSDTNILREFTEVQAFAGECGGCGPVPTSGDVRAFLGDWLQQDSRRTRILDATITHFGMALRSDGKGRKVAILLLGAE